MTLHQIWFSLLVSKTLENKEHSHSGACMCVRGGGGEKG